MHTMRLVISTIPAGAAKDLAGKIVGERLAACVNIAPKVESVYIWEGKLEREAEALMLIKTTAAAIERLTRRIKELHPYTVPEIISIEIKDDEGNPDYLKWVNDSVV
jgi:periplasmic divalent cation tolerance protein